MTSRSQSRLKGGVPPHPTLFNDTKATQTIKKPETESIAIPTVTTISVATPVTISSKTPRNYMTDKAASKNQTNSPRARGVLFVLKGPYDLRFQPIVKFSQESESARLTKIILSKSTVKTL